MDDTELVPGAWRSLWALVLGFFMILVDSTIVSVAIPAIMTHYRADVGLVIWVSSSYLLGYAVPLLITGRLGDRFGPKRMYLIGLSVFTLASLWCGLSPTIGALIAARAVQGLGASMMSPQTMAVITRTFPPQRRGAAMGLWGSTAGVATLVGPILGGVLVDSLGWETIFYVNVPVGIVAYWMAWRNVPKLETHTHQFDWLGVALSGVGMFCIVFGLQEGETYDWGTISGPVTVWGVIAAGVVVFAAFIWWQARNKREPLVPLGLFSNRNFGNSNLGVMVMGAIATAMSFPMMLYLQTARGLTPTQAAVLMAPTAIASLVLAPVVGRWIDAHDPRPLVIGGFALVGASLAAYALVTNPQIDVLWYLAPSLLMGVAATGVWGPLSVSATRTLGPAFAGAGAGVYNASRQLGAVIGSAATAALIENRISAHLPGAVASGHGSGSLPAALRAPYSAAQAESLWLPAAIAVLGVISGLLLQRRPGRGDFGSDPSISPETKPRATLTSQITEAAP